MGLFNFLEPEVFYFHCRATRYFGVCDGPIQVDLKQNTDAQVVGKYHETIDRYMIADRHSHLSRVHSIELWRKTIRDNLLKEFKGNISVSVCLSDEECYAQHCDNAIEFDCMVESMCK